MMARTSLIALLMAFSDLEKRKHENFQGNQLKPYEASLMSRISLKNVTWFWKESWIKNYLKDYS